MGVRSTAILFGSWIRPLLIACAVGFAGMLTLAGWLNHQGPAYYLFSVGGTVIHLLWQFKTVDLEVPESCWSGSILFDHALAESLTGPAFREFQSKWTARLDRLGRTDN